MSVIDSLFNDPPQGWPPRADIPAQPGIYAIFLKESEKLPFEFIEYYNSIKKKGNYRLAYIGKAKNSLRSRLGNHFDGKNSGSSTLRRSVGAWRKKQLSLVATRRSDGSPSNYCFVGQGEAKLTKWMRESPCFSYAVRKNPAEIEKELIAEYQPPLNIDHSNPSPWKKLENARLMCRLQAWRRG